MRRLEMDEIRPLCLEVLRRIKEVCDKNGIRYSLSGGTLIGAVRHNGFIPWDDDIDIMMPRPDYDRFIEIASKTDCGFSLYSYENCGDDYWYPFAKACHKNTLLCEKGMSDSNIRLGIYVDIFPVDGIADTYKSAMLRCKLFKILHGLRLASNWKKFRRSKIRGSLYEPLRFGCYLLSKLFTKRFLGKKLDEFVRKKPFEKSKYVGRLVGDYGSKEVVSKKLFESYTNVSFEGTEFSAISEYNSFLTSLYGDYMTPPPKEKQVTHHDYEAYWVE